MAYTQADLDLANEHVERAEELVAAQRTRVESLHQDGHPTQAAEELLAVLVATLDQLTEHRDNVAARVAPRKP